MKFTIQDDKSPISPTSCLVMGVFEGNILSPALQTYDEMSQQYLSTLLKQGDFQGKTGQTLMLYQVPHIPVERILLVGCGKNETLLDRDYHKIILNSIKTIVTTKATQVISFLPELTVQQRDMRWKIKQAVIASLEALYTFNTYKSEKEPGPTLQEITFSVPNGNDVTEAMKEGFAIADSMAFTKNLANQPSNVCTPAYLAEQATRLSKEYDTIQVKILDVKELEQLGMGALLAVGKGSQHPPKLICLEYKGTTTDEAPIALVGKGITFDTGGLSLKPADSMVGMKYDMCGAATVLGTFKATAELHLPLHLVGILACAENMPGGFSYKPEDIVTTLSGQTVEVMNTDAEGRLVLADALTYCERYHPDVVIDIATLTGAVVIALGHHASGLLSNHEPLAHALLAAGNDSIDRAWQLPLWEEYQEQLKSPFADMSNVGGRTAGVITAACFLSRFTKKFHWAHLDVAGTAAMMGGNDRYATGRPIPLLMQYLMNRCHTQKN